MKLIEEATHGLSTWFYGNHRDFPGRALADGPGLGLNEQSRAGIRRAHTCNREADAIPKKTRRWLLYAGREDSCARAWICFK